jgi:hypothetical protein
MNADTRRKQKKNGLGVGYLPFLIGVNPRLSAANLPVPSRQFR